jgi:hypothetical protein
VQKSKTTDCQSDGDHREMTGLHNHRNLFYVRIF